MEKVSGKKLSFSCVGDVTDHSQIITTEEAPSLGTKSSWRDVPAQEQQSLMHNVKERLRQEEIPRPNDDLEKAIQWRMPQVFKAHKAKGAGKLTRAAVSCMQPRTDRCPRLS